MKKTRLFILSLLIIISCIASTQASELYTDAYSLPDVKAFDKADIVKEEYGRTCYKTPFKGVYIWVKLGNYNPSNPPGISLYRHGGGGRGKDSDAGQGNPWFHTLETTLNNENLIWVKIIQSENIRRDDVQLQWTLYALAKTFASYKVIEGRGMLSGFSRGGEHMSYYINKTGGWPFHHVHSESGLMWSAPGKLLRPISWCLSAGQNEWTDWKIGPSCVARNNDLVKLWKKNPLASRDITVVANVNEGHGTNSTEYTAALTLAAFRRSDTFIAPFIYTGEMKDTKLKQFCQQRQLGAAYKQAKKSGAQEV
ncbi:MAG: hypothetical protein HRU15_06330, partial [Planctomycetes bacterium]|nr:hypothetical protein [Planctomycetota bacterium]